MLLLALVEMNKVDNTQVKQQVASLAAVQELSELKRPNFSSSNSPNTGGGGGLKAKLQRLLNLLRRE